MNKMEFAILVMCYLLLMIYLMMRRITPTRKYLREHKRCGDGCVVETEKDGE